MKYNFSFIQVINWLVVCKNNLLKLQSEVANTPLDKQALVEKLKAEKRKILLVKDILNRKIKLQGVNAEFLKNFNKLKEEYGIKSKEK